MTEYTAVETVFGSGFVRDDTGHVIATTGTDSEATRLASLLNSQSKLLEIARDAYKYCERVINDGGQCPLPDSIWDPLDELLDELDAAISAAGEE